MKAAVAFAVVALVNANEEPKATKIEGNLGNTDFKGATVRDGDIVTGDWSYETKNDEGEVVRSERKRYYVEGDLDSKDKESRKNWKMYEETQKKFDKYFYYTLETKNLEIGSEQGQCQVDSDCGGSGEAQKCCVNAIMRDKETGVQHQNYRCMTKSVVNANFDLTIDDMDVSMRCSQATGAISMDVSALSAVALAMTLY